MRCKNCAHKIYSDNREGMWSHQSKIDEERCFEAGQEGGLCDCTNPEPPKGWKEAGCSEIKVDKLAVS